MILIAGGALRLARAYGTSLWFDELYTVRASRLPVSELLREVPASGHPPLYYLLGHFLLPVSNSELVARSLSLAAGVLSIVLAYRLARELFSHRAGLWVAALAALSPSLVMLSAEATDYSLFIAASLAALLLLVRGVRRGGLATWTGFTLVSAAMLFTHGLGLVFLLAGALFYLILDSRPRRRLKSWLASQVILSLIAAGWYLMMSAGPGLEHVPGPGLFLSGIGQAPRVIIAGPAGVPLVGTSWIAFLALFLTAGALLLLSGNVRRSVGSREAQALVILLILVIAIPVALALGVVSFSAEQISVRYYSAAVMPLLLLMALFISAAPKRWATVAGVVALAGMLFLSVSTLLSGSWDYRSMMATIARGQQPGDRLLCLPVHHCVVSAEFYLEELMLVTGGWVNEEGEVLLNAEPGKVWSNYTADDDEVALMGKALTERLDDELAGAARVWLVTGDGSIPSYPDSDEVVAALGAGWREAGSWEFAAPFRLRLFVPAMADAGS